MNRLTYTSSLLALFLAASPALAQTAPTASDDSTNANASQDIVVTATRRTESIQDVPLSVTVFSQEELTQKGIVGYEGIARETPGATLNLASDNNARLTVRGVSTNGWGAGLQTTSTIYLDELPLSSVGNTVTLNPNLYDVERVEFLRGPQGTLFGSGSLSGALRILTHSPDLTRFDASALVDIGVTPASDSLRQRYNAMVNVPLVENVVGLRFVGFYRDEEGYIDNVGHGVDNANTLVDYGGRAVMLWEPSNRMSIRLMASYENNEPEDASLTNPTLGERRRNSSEPDRYTSETSIFNATVNYDFDGADLVSSSTFSNANNEFVVDLRATYGVPWYLRDYLEVETFVQELRLVSDEGGAFDWVLGGFYMRRESDLEGIYASSPAFLTLRGLTGLTDAVWSRFGNTTTATELAAFGNLTYHLTDQLSLTGGLRFGRYDAETDVDAGFNSNYIVRSFGLPGPVTVTPTAARSVSYPQTERTSWLASLSYEPSDDLTLYGTISTGYRTPVYNARAGSVSVINPSDLVIPDGADSDDLTNYELGMKGRFFDGRLRANVAVYYIDWRDLQVQANRVSDAVQFATNVGGAVSQGVEAELVYWPTSQLMLGLNASFNDAEITDLSASEANISGAEEGARLASPRVQGSFYGMYNYRLSDSIDGFTSFQVQHVDGFPNGFPNRPGTAGTPSALYGETDAYTYVNMQTGVLLGNLSITLYGENLGDSDAVVYIHPESFIDSRYAILRPRTFGVRFNYHM